MANLKQAFEYAAQNPNSDFAKNLEQLVASGSLDKEAEKFGIDLTPFKSTQTESTLGQELKQRGINAINAVKNTYTTNEDIYNDPSLTKTQKIVGELSNTAQLPLRVAGQAGGAVGDVIGAAVSPLISGAASAIKSVLPQDQTQQPEGPAQPSLYDKAMTAWKTFEQNNPVAAQNLADVGNLFNLTGAGGVAKGVATGVTEKAIPATINVAKKTANVTSKALKGTGETIYSSAYTPSVAEAERILAYEATKPSLASKLYGAGALEGNPAFKPITVSDTALRTGIAGTEKQIGTQAKQVADTLYKKEIAPAVKSIEGVITKDELFTPLQENINKIVDPTKQKAYQNALDSLAEDYVNIKQLTYPEAQALKSELAQFTPAKVFRGQDVANETRMLQADIAKIIREKTYDALKDVNIKQKYIDYGNLQELQKVGIKAISEAGKKGGFGGFWTSVYDAAMTPIKTVGGKVLYRIGDKLEVTAPKGFEGKPLKDYLQSVGYLAPATVTNSSQQ